ncbi:hypothetical protein F511_37346 [Dorcoceras hygrometricum]|uniref:Uncharacterized protein n=1 Tax=Dorcoceras hygrometricum TaxID=472368 RepID=A0A2Z7CEQ7_9LAMI|nr:hypothetical protein F511_37346 [Dorcoceras hygrometricum]
MPPPDPGRPPPTVDSPPPDDPTTQTPSPTTAACPSKSPPVFSVIPANSPDPSISDAPVTDLIGPTYLHTPLTETIPASLAHSPIIGPITDDWRKQFPPLQTLTPPSFQSTIPAASVHPHPISTLIWNPNVQTIFSPQQPPPTAVAFAVNSGSSTAAQTLPPPPFSAGFYVISAGSWPPSTGFVFSTASPSSGNPLAKPAQPFDRPVKPARTIDQPINPTRTAAHRGRGPRRGRGRGRGRPRRPVAPRAPSQETTPGTHASHNPFEVLTSLPEETDTTAINPTLDPSPLPTKSVSPNLTQNPAKTLRNDLGGKVALSWDKASPSDALQFPPLIVSGPHPSAKSPSSLDPSICLHIQSGHPNSSPTVSPLQISSSLMSEMISRQGQPSTEIGMVALDVVSHDGSDIHRSSTSCDGTELGRSLPDTNMHNVLKRKMVPDAKLSGLSSQESTHSLTGLVVVFLYDVSLAPRCVLLDLSVAMSMEPLMFVGCGLNPDSLTGLVVVFLYDVSLAPLLLFVLFSHFLFASSFDLQSLPVFVLYVIPQFCIYLGRSWPSPPPPGCIALICFQ